MASNDITHALATRTDLPPRARQVLATQLAECVGLVTPIVGASLDDLDQELFGIAEQSSGGQVQHEALEALRELKRTRPGFLPALRVALAGHFAGLGITKPHAPTRRAERDLSLLDPAELDETVALDDLVNRSEAHIGDALFQLGYRYAALIAGAPVDAAALPPGPAMLADALRAATATLGLQRDQRILFYRLCERRLAAAAESIYARLNEHIKAAGILPDLRGYIPRARRKAPPGPPVPGATSASSKPAPAPESEPRPAIGFAPAPGAAPSFHGATDFSPEPSAGAPGPRMPELHRMLADRRHALAQPGAAVQAHTPAATPAVDSAQVDAALAALQARAQPAALLDGASLQSTLVAELRRTNPAGPAPRLGDEQADVVSLVALLYERLFAETSREGSAQRLLAGLQVPLLRAALADPDFFTVREHPARRFLNNVLEAANLWLDRSDGSFDNVLNARLQRSVQKVAKDFQGDMAVIAHEADDLGAHLHTLKRRADIAERRQVEAARGRDRLHGARATARAATAQRLAKHPAASPLVRAVLEQAWSDALTLTLLRDGADSAAYREQLAVADQLLEPDAGGDRESFATELRRGLMQVGVENGEIDAILREALGADTPGVPAADSGAAPGQTQIMLRLRNRHASDEDAASAGKAPAAARKLSLTTSERRALDALKGLPFGSWLEFTVNQQGHKVARKLAWHSALSGHCLLVDARGTAAPEQTLEQVARLLARGLVRIPSDNEPGLLDRSWNKLIASLRKFSHLQTTAETRT